MEGAPARDADKSLWPVVLPLSGKPVHVAFDGGRQTSAAGVLVLSQIKWRLGLAKRLAGCLSDPRAPERVRHSLAEIIRFCILSIAAGDPDAKDCDALRIDPAFKMAVGRSGWRSSARAHSLPDCTSNRPVVTLDSGTRRP